MNYLNVDLEKLLEYSNERKWTLFKLKFWQITQKYDFQNRSDYQKILEVKLFELIISSIRMKKSESILRWDSKIENDDSFRLEIDRLNSKLILPNISIEEFDNFLYFYVSNYQQLGKKNLRSKILPTKYDIQIGSFNTISPFYREKMIDDKNKLYLIEPSFDASQENELLNIDFNILMINKLTFLNNPKNIVIRLNKIESNCYYDSMKYKKLFISSLIELLLQNNYQLYKVYIDWDTSEEKNNLTSILDEIYQFIFYDKNFERASYNLIGSFDQKKVTDTSKIDTLKEAAVKLRKQFSTNSTKMDEAFRYIYQIKDTDESILLLGETGTGKQLLSELIHHSSNRSKYKFIDINCSSVQRDLLHSELFGHTKGAFTGATTDKKGLFEEANKGTLLLDEIGDAPLDVQQALLKFFDSKKIRRVGSTVDIEVDVRIILATNKNLENLVKEGKLKSDLYYRIRTNPISILPLRERFDDLEGLVISAQSKFQDKWGIKLEIKGDFIEALKTYSWPGNFRELSSVLKSIFISAPGNNKKIIDAKLFNKFLSSNRVDKLNFNLELYEEFTLDFFKHWISIREKIVTELMTIPELEYEKPDSNLLSFGRSVIEPILANVYTDNWKSLGIQSQKKAGETIGLTWAGKEGTLIQRHKLYPVVKKFFGGG